MRTKFWVVLITTLNLTSPFYLSASQLSTTLARRDVLIAGGTLTAASLLVTLVCSHVHGKHRTLLKCCEESDRERHLRSLRNSQRGTIISLLCAAGGMSLCLAHTIAKIAETHKKNQYQAEAQLTRTQQLLSQEQAAHTNTATRHNAELERINGVLSGTQQTLLASTAEVKALQEQVTLLGKVIEELPAPPPATEALASPATAVVEPLPPTPASVTTMGDISSPTRDGSLEVMKRLLEKTQNDLAIAQAECKEAEERFNAQVLASENYYVEMQRRLGDTQQRGESRLAFLERLNLQLETRLASMSPSDESYAELATEIAQRKQLIERARAPLTPASVTTSTFSQQLGLQSSRHDATPHTTGVSPVCDYTFSAEQSIPVVPKQPVPLVARRLFSPPGAGSPTVAPTAQ